MDIVVWLLIGLVAGFLARILVPGRNRMSLVATIVLGLIGSVIGGLLGDLLTKGDQEFAPAGILGSILGAIIALLVWRAVTQRRRGILGGRRSIFR
jgi:uncharacterized membrane protein YeaQ/YmgE (transglycosylase-associated protein family)